MTLAFNMYESSLEQKKKKKILVLEPMKYKVSLKQIFCFCIRDVLF